MFRRFVFLFVCFGFLFEGMLLAHANDQLNFFRLGTGEVNSVSTQMGGVIASAVSKPPRMMPCGHGGSCGVPGMVVAAYSSAGSKANIEAMEAGKLDGAFVQADMLYWAYNAKGAFVGEKPHTDLRALASLFHEVLHVVVRNNSAISKMSDLKGRKVNLGVPHSDTWYESKLLLAAYGMDESDVDLDESRRNLAVTKLRTGEIDALFLVSGYPDNDVQFLLDTGKGKLLSLEEHKLRGLSKQFSFLYRTHIPAEVYGTRDIATFGLPTIFVTTKKVDEKVGYQILQAIWNETTRSYLDQAHLMARDVTYASSFQGVQIPLHVGAMRYHEEREILKAQRIRALEAPETSPFDFSLKAFADGLERKK